MYLNYASNFVYNIPKPYSFNSLENRIYSLATMPAETKPIIPFYEHKSTGYRRRENDEPRVSITYHSDPKMFLRQDRPLAQFVSNAEAIRGLILEAFMHVTGKNFPDDIVIRVCSSDEMLLFNENWHPGILGFAFNRLGFGVSEIFLLNNELDVLMLTAGHEIGHVFSFPAGSRIDEEAKAFAFESAWMQAIFLNNIGGLKDSLSFNAFSPAANGIHDNAFLFVRRLLFFGMTPLDIYHELATGALKFGG